jgi:hypothetical protein
VREARKVCETLDVQNMRPNDSQCTAVSYAQQCARALRKKIRCRVFCNANTAVEEQARFVLIRSATS